MGRRYEMHPALITTGTAIREHRRRVEDAERRRAESSALQRARLRQAVRRAVRQFLEQDGDPRELIEEFPGWIRCAEQRRKIEEASACRGCVSSR